MKNQEGRSDVFIRVVGFLFGLGLAGWEAVIDHSHSNVVYLVAALFGGGPFASLVEAFFLGRIQISVRTKPKEENDPLP